MGSCILFAYHIQKRTQNGSQSPLEGQGEMKIEDRGDKKKKKKKKARFEAFVSSCDANSVQKHGRQS